jgi:mannuronan 5-epimerase
MPELRPILVAALLLLLLGGQASAFGFEDMAAMKRQLEAFRQRVELSSAAPGTLAFQRDLEALLPPGGLPSAQDRQSDESLGAGMVTGKAADVEIVDTRILLTQLAIQTGTNDHLSLYQALGGAESKAVLIQGGSLTLSELTELIAESEAPDAIMRGDKAVLANLPLVIWNDSSLSLEPGDRLSLNRETGAFVLSFGKLVASEAVIRSEGGINPGEQDFRPFVLATASGSLDLQDSEIEGLGFGRNPVFGGVAYVTGGLMRSNASSRVEGNVVRDTATIALINAENSTVSSNRIEASRGPALLVEGGTYVRIEDNSLLRSGGDQAIRISGTAENVSVTGNVVLWGKGTGIFVDGGASYTDVSGNLVSGVNGGGIGLKTTACTVVSGNLVADNREKGLSVKESYKVHLSDNHILGNGSAGISVSEQPLGAAVEIDGNLLSGNRSALRGAEAARLVLAGNDIESQLPKLLTGDLAQQTNHFLSSQGLLGQEVVLTSPTAPGATERSFALRTAGFQRCLEQEAG